MQAWNPGASEVPTADRLEDSSRGAKRFFPARYRFSAGLLRPRRFGVSQAAAQGRQAPCCHPLSHPDVFLQPSV